MDRQGHKTILHLHACHGLVQHLMRLGGNWEKGGQAGKYGIDQLVQDMFWRNATLPIISLHVIIPYLSEYFQPIK